jgi:hypothetical protein
MLPFGRGGLLQLLPATGQVVLFACVVQTAAAAWRHLQLLPLRWLCLQHSTVHHNG